MPPLLLLLPSSPSMAHFQGANGRRISRRFGYLGGHQETKACTLARVSMGSGESLASDECPVSACIDIMIVKDSRYGWRSQPDRLDC